MKKILIMLFILTIASCSNSSWKKALESEVTFTHTVAGFVNEGLGITAGYAGEVHFTNDGGKDWPRAQNQTMCRFAIDALESGELIHAGNGGTVAFSADGKSWTKLETPISGKAMLVNFYDTQHGAAVNASGEVKYTVDGGKSWQDMVKPESAVIILAIDQFSEKGLVLLDFMGELHVTNDLGATWNKVTLDPDKYDINFKKLASNSASIRFADAQNGTIAVIAPADDAKKSSVVILRTADGAKTFSAEKIPCELNAATKIFLSPDSMYLTVNGMKKVELFRHI